MMKKLAVVVFTVAGLLLLSGGCNIYLADDCVRRGGTVVLSRTGVSPVSCVGGAE